MKKIFLLVGWLLTISACFSQGFTRAEYYFDTDPGIGNGIAISLSSSTDTVNFTSSIPTASLTPGFHFLVIRSLHSGTWSLGEPRGFYISQATADATNIVTAEYFIDNDPGAGKGVALSIGSSDGTVNFTAAVPTTSLAPGFHFLAIRAKDTEGKWGLFETRGFYISTITADAADIVAAEYFMDNDPGAGLGTALSIGSSGGTVNFTAPVPTTSLAPGFHFLAIRVKDTEGKWGLFETRGFYISQATTNVADIVSAEYFFDNDPGAGSGEPLTFSSPGPNVTQVFSIPVPSGFTSGNHLLAIRVKNSDNTWGLFEIDTVNVSTTLPIAGLLFTAEKQNHVVQLNWSTLSEFNTGHFEIERSQNGVSFEKLSSLPAAGNSSIQRNYSYTDFHPGSRFNYYRIKQVDKDEKHTYSLIKMIRFTDATLYSVFPTITQGKINVSGIAEKLNIKLYNTHGQLMKMVMASTSPTPIDVSSFASGTYWVVIEKNAQILHTQKIVKQ